MYYFWSSLYHSNKNIVKNCSAAVFVKKSSLKEGAQQLNVNSLSNYSEWMPCYGIYYMTHISGLSPMKDLETAFKISNKYSSYYEAVLMVIFLINNPLASNFDDRLLSNTHSKSLVLYTVEFGQKIGRYLEQFSNTMSTLCNQ